MKPSFLLLTTLALFFISTALTAQPSIGGYKVYYGHLHNHSNVSDGAGTPDEAYNYAKNTSHLDFFGLSDHSDGAGSIDVTEWSAMQTAANTYNEPGVFTAFRGFEWTSPYYGHITVINSDDYCTAGSSVITFTGLCDWLNSRECIAFFNHPGYSDYPETEFNNFSTTPSSKMVGIELWTMLKDFSVYYYSDGYYPNDGNKGYYDEALLRNWDIGAFGNEDNHAGTWGSLNDHRMAILANANTREDLYDALKARRFYSTLDKNLALSFKINNSEMGSTLQLGSYGVHILASDGDGELFTQVQLLKNGTVVNTWLPNLAAPDITLNLSFTNYDYYYVRVKQADGDEAISSPIWISDGNQVPVVSITSPVPGDLFTAPATVTIAASATDGDGTIAKVDFYYGSSLLISDNTAPYSYTATNVPVGSYPITALATDNAGATTTSAPVTIVVVSNQPPVVSITSPVSGAIFTAPATVTITATATDGDGTITKVEFYQGSTLLGSDNTTPYSYTWTNVPAGSYSLTAKATDNTGAVTTSAPVAITVGATNKPPVVSVTSPVSGSIFTAPASVTITASASDADGTITNVDFYYESSLLISDNTAPYSYTATNVPVGSYSLTAKATDNTGAVTTSAPVTVVVASNQSPVVSITSPVSGAIFTAPATVTINATASDADGTITKVEFYQGSTLLGSDNTSPYSYTWTNMVAGSYSLTARATDNTGASTASPAINIIVNPASGDYTFTIRIQSGPDDVEESASGSVVLNSDDIELVYDNKTTGNQVVGLRFNGIIVPKGAIVTNASIQFTVDEADNGTCNLTVKGEYTANAQLFLNTTKNVSNRARTTASVSWNPSKWSSAGSSGASQKSPDLKAIVQEVINSAAWNSGNSMVFIITGTGTRTAESYEGAPAKAALLTIAYSIPGTLTTEKSGNLETPLKSGNLETPKIETLVKSPNLVCYPIPFKNQLYIKFIPVDGESVTAIEIFNAVGKCILNRMHNDTEIVMDIPDFKPGIYIVRLKTNKGLYNKSVIKE